jgi:hypothetical protein
MSTKKLWVVHNPLGDNLFCNTENEAVRKAQELIDSYFNAFEDEWDDEVISIRISKIEYYVISRELKEPKGFYDYVLEKVKGE